MKTLHLTLKKKWFDMILSGEKKQEYRDIKTYWINRLLSNFSWDINKYPIKINGEKKVHNKGSFLAKKFDLLIFKNGYASDAPEITIEFKGIEVGEGNPEWGAEPGKKYFVITLGEIIETKNLKNAE